MIYGMRELDENGNPIQPKQNPMMLSNDATDRRQKLATIYEQLKKKADDRRASALLNAGDVNPVSMADIEATRNQGRDFAFAEGLANAANRIGNVRGKYEKSSLGDTLGKIQEADVGALRQRQGLFDSQGKQLDEAMNSSLLDEPLSQEMTDAMNGYLAQTGSKMKLPNGLTSRQIEQSPVLKKLLTASQQYALSPADIVNPNTGQTERWMVNKTTGQAMYKVGVTKESPSELINQTTDAKVRQANAINTGTTSSEVAKTVAVKTAEGKVTSQTGVERDASKEIGNQVQAGMIYNDMDKYAKDAKKKIFLSGPGFGQFSQLANLAGFAPDSEAASFEAKFKSMLTDYIQAKTGAAMGVEEAKRLGAVIPGLADTDALFNAKMKALKEMNAQALRAKMLGVDAAKEYITNPQAPVQGKPAQATLKKASELPNLKGK